MYEDATQEARTRMTKNLTAASPKPEDDTFLRSVVFPEEDRHLFTSRAWNGEFRWFRSPNVIPIEKWRKVRRHYGPAQEK